jgi:hypothetical protein
MVEGWPNEAKKALERGSGSEIMNYLLPKPLTPHSNFLNKLRQFLDKAGVLRPDARAPYAWQTKHYLIGSVTPIPNWRDRQAHSKEFLLGDPPLLYKNHIETKRPRWNPKKTTHIYLDISGSMNKELPWLVGALSPLHKRGLCRLYVFSTIVDEIKKGMFLKDIKNTYGTDIKCVYRHILNLPHRATPSRVIVLTDGFTGIPTSKLQKEMQKRKVDLFVGLVGHGSEELKPFAKQMMQLPEFN